MIPDSVIKTALNSIAMKAALYKLDLAERYHSNGAADWQPHLTAWQRECSRRLMADQTALLLRQATSTRPCPSSNSC